MDMSMVVLRGTMALAIAAGLAASAGATTLRRASLDDLVTRHGTVVVGRVLDARAYWNAEKTFILTEVRIAADEVLKGRLESEELTVTVMGGRVGELMTFIVGGAELIPGRSYLLFLKAGNLPGARGVLTVREHSQGVFDLVRAGDGLRAVSQASRQPLVPDAQGRSEAPGGAEGLPLASMIESIREMARRPQAGRGVQR